MVVVVVVVVVVLVLGVVALVVVFFLHPNVHPPQRRAGVAHLLSSIFCEDSAFDPSIIQTTLERFQTIEIFTNEQYVEMQVHLHVVV